MDEQVKALYKAWIQGWNAKDAKAMANLLSENGHVIGYDGSQMNGGHEVEEALGKIFQSYPTGQFVSIIKEVKFLAPQVSFLHAIVGMVPRGLAELNPSVNAIQSMIAVQEGGSWKLSLLQNTPAAFHLEPDKAREMTEELTSHFKKYGID